MKKNEYYFGINSINGNSVAVNCGVRCSSDFTEEKLARLEAGEEILDYDGTLISMYFEEEEEE